MKASILGADGNILCQVNALRDGFAKLGHEHTPNVEDIDTSFVFIGNPPFDKYEPLLRSGNKKTILNVLDIPWHVPEVNDFLESLKKYLPLANRVTTISKTVQADLKKALNIDASVIYYPMKPVFYSGIKKHPQFKVAMVGRLSDKNKFGGLAALALINAGFQENEVAIVGPEYFGWGTRLGEITDSELNDIYNSVDYVIMLDKVAGIGLPAIEAACCGAIPIVAWHLATLDEFWAQSPLGLHYQKIRTTQDLTKLILAIEQNPQWKKEIKQDLLGYSKMYFAPKFDAKNVASKIIEVYHSI
jgi:glycosyltransferase involved in cell wall biosynthesis